MISTAKMTLEKATRNKQRVVVSPGTYILGDPCYSIDYDDWDFLISGIDYRSETPDPVLYLPNKHPVLMFRTAFGDGLYRGSDGFDYGVDSGNIGLVPVEAVRFSSSVFFTRRAHFASEFTCRREPDGMLWFGDISIDTRRAAF